MHSQLPFDWTTFGLVSMSSIILIGILWLALLGAASQRIEYLAIELFGTPWLKEILAGWKRRERGSLPGMVESGVILYVISNGILLLKFLKLKMNKFLSRLSHW